MTTSNIGVSIEEDFPLGAQEIGKGVLDEDASFPPLFIPSVLIRREGDGLAGRFGERGRGDGHSYAAVGIDKLLPLDGEDEIDWLEVRHFILLRLGMR